MLTLDTRDFERALLNYEAATGRDLPEVLNRAGKNIAYRTASFTKPALAGQIERDLTRGADEHFLAALTSIRLRKKGIGRVAAPQFRKEMTKTLMGRIGSKGYMRYAWAEAIEKFGGNFRGKRLAGASAEVIKATVNSLLTAITASVNQPTEAKAASAEEKMMPALQEAVDFVAADMLEYAAKKMQANAKKAGF